MVIICSRFSSAMEVPYSEADKNAFHAFRSTFSVADQTITFDQYRALTLEELNELIEDAGMLPLDTDQARMFHPSSKQGE